ncbi:hypothetical protein Vretimale_10361 [Volvox reticuliferus]|uniref:Uncharacterized protein n=1 Tax=Volvox reticuliferus TaxID=1737510 RepID=A0A8J4CKJ6_9CHLO|nr:hypothetical protein Vretifemale_12417 [Volvox reticuliferus]GIM06049.1 hypothetical protein Vretimale_10361 [Volvox reticuliferus]
MACNLFLWPLRPPPALVPPSAELKSKFWNAADTALRCMAAERTGLARRGGGGVGGRGTGRFRSSSSSSGSTSGKRGSPEGETSCGQFLPPLQPLPAACINGPEPSADVAEHEFFTGLGGWMPVASGSSQLANIRTHLKSKGHNSRMQTLRLLVRSSACHYAWLPKLVAGVRLCHFLVPEPEQLRVLGNDEAATILAAVAAIPGATDHGAAAAEMAGKGLDDVRQKDGTGMDETEQPQQQGNTEDERDWQEVGEYNTDDQGVPHGASLAGVAGQSGCNALAAAEQRVAMAAAGFFVEASLALLDIAEGRLYRLAGYLSFADYVESASSVLGFGLRQARNLIAAARFVRNLPPDVAPPSCERQVRPLVGFHTDLQIRAWALALERAGGVGSMRVSGRLVEECLREVKGLLADAAMGPDVIATKHQRQLPVHYGGLHVFTRSETCEWYTPDFILDLVRELFAPGHIDLDPCSCAAANTRVRAISYYDERMDGLAEMNEWNGNVFLNPAFGMRDGHSLQGLFFAKCTREYQAGNLKQAVVLLKAGIGYSWFHDVLNWPVCFLGERISFVRQVPTGASGELQWGTRVQNPHGSVLVYMGPATEKFANLFSRVGSVPGMNAWAHRTSAPRAPMVMGGEEG